MSDSPDPMFDLRVQLRLLNVATETAIDALANRMFSVARRELKEIRERVTRINQEAVKLPE